MSLRRSLARLLAVTERAASRAADGRLALARLRRARAFTDRSRDNRLAHQRRADK
jgi:hypothetical protein